MARSAKSRLAGAGGITAGVVIGGAALVAGGWIGYSRVAIDHDLPLLPAIDAARRVAFGPAYGELSYYAGPIARGRPLLLLHSVNAAASAYEVRPIFARFAGERPVFAPDLPGFGFSARADLDYTPDLYATAIVDLLERVVGSDGAADVVALSLSAEFAARVAVERPDLVRSLTLISPTGFAARDGGEHAGDRRGGWLYKLIACPLWAQPFYDLLTSRPSIRYFLRRSFHGPLDAALAAYDYATAHQPGARHAPLRFVGGLLFTPSVRTRFYARVQQPTLVLYDEDGFTGFAALPSFLEAHPNWRGERIAPTRGLPQFEQPEATFAALAAFWRELDAPATRVNGYASASVRPR